MPSQILIFWPGCASNRSWVDRHIDLKRELEELRKKAEGVFKPQRRMLGLRHRSRRVARAPGARGARCGSRTRSPGRRRRSEREPSSASSRTRARCGRTRRPFTASISRRSGARSSRRRAGFAALRPLKTARPERVCYLDIETTGLRMSPLFLVGLMYTSRRGASSWISSSRGITPRRRRCSDSSPRCMPRFDILVTFNGITFDVPYIRERMTIHRLAFAAAAGAHRSSAARAQRRRRENAEPPAPDARDALLQAQARRGHRGRRYTRPPITSSCGRTTRRTWRISFTTTGSIS